MAPTHKSERVLSSEMRVKENPLIGLVASALHALEVERDSLSILSGKQHFISRNAIPNSDPGPISDDTPTNSLSCCSTACASWNMCSLTRLEDDRDDDALSPSSSCPPPPPENNGAASNCTKPRNVRIREINNCF